MLIVPRRIRYSLFFLMLPVIPQCALAESFFCVPEAGATIKDNMKGEFHGNVADINGIKFVLSNRNGSWTLNQHGGVELLKCANEYDCINDIKSGRFFSRYENGEFLMLELMINDGSAYHVLLKGKCSAI